MTIEAQTRATAQPPGLVCPTCSQPLARSRRYFSDRVRSLFSDPAQPLRRYVCTDLRCGWHGLLRGHLERGTGDRPGYPPGQFL